MLLDYSKGFGGQFGIQKDCQDKSAFDWSHRENLEQHESQKGKEFFIFEKKNLEIILKIKKNKL